jgi:hypothetical protein
LAKIAFITQDIGVYGSSRSLQLMLRGLIDKNYFKEEDIIIVYPRALKINSNYKLKKKFYNSYFSIFNNSKSWIMPFSNIIDNINSSSIEKVKRFIRTLLFFIFWMIKYKKQFKKANIEQIYLNSITLWPMLFVLPKHIKTIIHIREILDLDKPFSKIAKSTIINKCSELIAIDKKTVLPFLDCNKKITIIRNPFEMKMARKLKEEKCVIISKKYGMNPDKIHVSLIGSIQEAKGQKFFYDIAKKCDGSNDFEFVIVGDGRGPYYNDVVNAVSNLENLHYIGKVENIEEIYAITHIVIRCDNFFPLGRTVWEAYYSGCKVLLPYNINDDISEIKDYLNKEIFLYDLRNAESAISKLKEIKSQGFGIDNNLPTGNIETHIKEISDILKI